MAPKLDELAPVTRLFERVHADFPGQILTVELKMSKAPLYRVKLLTEGGDVLVLAYDARTLHLESVAGRLAGGGQEKGQASGGQAGGFPDDDNAGDDDEKDDDHDKDDDRDRDDDHGKDGKDDD